MTILARRVRGFRVVDLAAFALLVAVILGVYLAKTIAGRERAQIATAERQIESEKARIRLLQAEVAHLEQPARIERLSESYLGLGPVAFKRDVTPDALAAVARHPAAAGPAATPPPDLTGPAPQPETAVR